MATEERKAEITNNKSSTLNPSPKPTPPKRKRKKKQKKPANHILQHNTIHDATWSYIHLQHLTSSPRSSEPLDAITVQMSLNTSLNQSFGLHGSAIRFDILKIEAQDVWIRVSAPDRAALVAAVGGSRGGSAEGWRVKGWSLWDAGVRMREGGWDLFGE